MDGLRALQLLVLSPTGTKSGSIDDEGRQEYRELGCGRAAQWGDAAE